MIAAFLDDMKTSSSGDVFYKIIDIGPNEQSVVIEWSIINISFAFLDVIIIYLHSLNNHVHVSKRH